MGGGSTPPNASSQVSLQAGAGGAHSYRNSDSIDNHKERSGGSAAGAPAPAPVAIGSVRNAARHFEVKSGGQRIAFGAAGNQVGAEMVRKEGGVSLLGRIEVDLEMLGASEDEEEFSDTEGDTHSRRRAHVHPSAMFTGNHENAGFYC
ncbi:hypothetical protein T484DRAFT_1895091 [Baffinella frigidus]|nr:hypothetical protein T484DRAFT_1895091 [Cryptophyta sp. CCMP2293]